MPELWPSWAELRPGADWWMNEQRSQDVRAVTLHKPQGTCPGVVSIGVSRNHGSPGTFNATLCFDGTLRVHYPWNVRCTHAAGGNAAGPGVEIEDYQGNECNDEQLRTLGRLIEWSHVEWGTPKAYYDGGLGRIWLDVHPFAGWLPHSAIDYPPNRSFLHYDGLLPGEWERAIMLGGSSAAQRAQEVPDVYIFRGRTVFGVPLGGVAAGDRVLTPLDGEDVNYGLSQAIIDWKSQPGRDAVPIIFLDPATLGALVQPPVQPGGGSTTVVNGLSAADVRAIVRAELDATKLARQG